MVALTDVTKLIDSKHDHSLRLPLKGRAYNRGDKSFLETLGIIGAWDGNGIRKEFIITPEPPSEAISIPLTHNFLPFPVWWSHNNSLLSFQFQFVTIYHVSGKVLLPFFPQFTFIYTREVLDNRKNSCPIFKDPKTIFKKENFLLKENVNRSAW